MPGFIGLGAAFSPGADWLQASAIHAQDTLTGRFIDSVVVDSPLPDPMVPIVQWLFQKPGWVMGGGIVLGAVVAVVRRRLPLAPPPGDMDLAGHPGSRGQARPRRGARSRAPADGGDRREGLRLHDARQRFLPGLPHLRAQRPGLRATRHRDLPAGQQDGGGARQPLLSRLPPLRARSTDQGDVLLDHGAPGQGAAPCQGSERDLRAVP